MDIVRIGFLDRSGCGPRSSRAWDWIPPDKLQRLRQLMSAAGVDLATLASLHTDHGWICLQRFDLPTQPLYDFVRLYEVHWFWIILGCVCDTRSCQTSGRLGARRAHPSMWYWQEWLVRRWEHKVRPCLGTMYHSNHLFGETWNASQHGYCQNVTFIYLYQVHGRIICSSAN